MTEICYAAQLQAQPDGGFTVTFPDIPEAISEGNDESAALANGREALALALAQRLEDGEPMPAPSAVDGGHWVEVDVGGR